MRFLLPALGGITGALAAWFLVGVPALCLVAAVVAAAAPALHRRRVQRLKAAETVAAWPDAIDLIRAAIRSGVAVPDAVAEPARRGPLVLRPRFAAYRWRLATGDSFEEALTALHDPADPVVINVAAALSTAARVGAADVGAVLSAMAEFQRAEVAQRREIDARLSWNIAAARLAVAAPWLTVAALSLQPEARAAYSSPGGTALLSFVLLLTIVAYWAMRRVARPEPAA
jgi:tight adherence protein B